MGKYLTHVYSTIRYKNNPFVLALGPVDLCYMILQRVLQHMYSKE